VASASRWNCAHSGAQPVCGWVMRSTKSSTNAASASRSARR
jgi:hypothetical protein